MGALSICKECTVPGPEEVVSQFLLFKQATGIAARTYKDYKKTISLLFSRFPDALDYPRKRTLEFLSSYENPCSYNVYYAYLKVFWDWSIAEGYIAGDQHPLSGLKKRKPRGRIVQFDDKEITHLLKQPDKTTYAGLRDYCLLCLQIDTGIRPGEALQLLPGDFNTERGEIIIRAEVSKTRTYREVPISVPTQEAIMKLLDVQPESWTDAPIFANETGAMLKETSWSRRVAAYGKKCGLKITAYHLRHVAALLLLRKGADVFTVQRMLGHATMDMTKHYLAALNLEDTKKGHKKAGVMLSLLGEDPPVNKRIRKL